MTKIIAIIMLVFILFSCTFSVDPRIKSLTTITDGGNGNHGVMFDVIAEKDLVISGIATHQSSVDPLSIPVAIYYRPGGISATRDGWILAGITTVSFPPSGTLVKIPIDVDLFIMSGQVYGIYVTSINEESICYSDSTGTGETYSNSDLMIAADGYGMGTPFISIPNANRTFNGTIYYHLF